MANKATPTPGSKLLTPKNHMLVEEFQVNGFTRRTPVGS